MVGPVGQAKAQDAFWEWIATYGEPWARARGYTRRGKRAEFYQRVGRLELVISIVRSRTSTGAEVRARLDAYVADVPSVRLYRKFDAKAKASGYQFIVFALGRRHSVPDPSAPRHYEIVAGSPLDSSARALPQDLDAFRAELEAVATAPRYERGILVRPHALPQTDLPSPRHTAGREHWFATTLRGVRTLDGRDTAEAMAYINVVDLDAATELLQTDSTEVRPLDQEPDPLPPDRYGEVLWRHPDDLDTPIWHEGPAQWWIPPFVWSTAPEQSTV